MQGPDGLIADKVKAHSELKRGFLEAYLKFWTKNVAGKRGKFAPSLDVYDLFASSGYCVDEFNPDHHWMGTPLVASEFLFEYPTRNPCYLYANSWSKDDKERGEKLHALNERLSGYHWGRDTKRFHHVECREFSDALDHALQFHSKRAQYANLWLLDPYSARTIPWSSLQRIMDAEGTWYDKSTGKANSRKPELFLNFMSLSLQRNPDPAQIAEVIGITEDEWIEFKEDYENILEALVDVFAFKIEKHYGRPPYIELVKGTHGNPVSAMMLIVQHDAPFYLIRKELPDYFEKWKFQKYTPQANRSKALQELSKKPGQRTLDDVF